MSQFLKNLEDHLNVFKKINDLNDVVESAANMLIEAAKKRRHIFICGNGGSASDSQHFSAELRGRFEAERIPLKATALTVDTSALTAIGNDYGYDAVFSRQLEALAEKDDVLIAITTSGNSKNVLKAVESAKKIGLKTIGLTGGSGGALKSSVDFSIVIPDNRTARIQEGHIFILHVLCEMIDTRAFFI